MDVAAAWLSLLLYVGHGITPVRKALERASKWAGEWGVLALLLPYLLAMRFRPVALDLVRYTAYLALPVLLLRVRSRRNWLAAVLRGIAVLAIWLPIEPGLFGLALHLAVPGVDASVLDATALPRVDATLVPGVELPVHTLTAVLLALYLFVARTPLKGIGFTFRLGWDDVRRALLGLLGFAVVGAPLGIALGFLRLNPRLPDPKRAAIAVLGGYLLVALPEEILFRGVIQNLLTERKAMRLVGQVAAAVIFGLAHLNNGTAGFPVPNWAYAAMATLAGLAYGWVWRGTHKVTASALTHMLVNLVWGAVFR